MGLANLGVGRCGRGGPRTKATQAMALVVGQKILEQVFRNLAQEQSPPTAETRAASQPGDARPGLRTPSRAGSSPFRCALATP
jgi:hypothetical protein